MSKAYIPAVLFALFTTFSVGAQAATDTKPVSAKPAIASSVTQDTVKNDVVSTVEGKVNINTADADALQSLLSGIGSAKAKAIVAYREANGKFSSVDELIEVKGIGQAILDKNRDKISI